MNKNENLCNVYNVASPYPSAFFVSARITTCRTAFESFAFMHDLPINIVFRFPHVFHFPKFSAEDISLKFISATRA